MVGCVLLISSSCETYKYGYWGKLPESGSVLSLKPDSTKELLNGLFDKKEDLNADASRIVTSMIKEIAYSKPIPMHTFNSLFENLREQYAIDTVFHKIYQHSDNDTIQSGSKMALLQSALFYKNVFYKDRFIRRTVNRGDKAFGIPANTLTHTQQFLWSDKSNRRFLAENNDDKKTTHTVAGFFLSKNLDKFQRMGYEIIYFASKIFGEFTGQFHGKIDRKTNAMLLRSQIQEFDIVLLKSTTHLTERFIPGYFGHAGVCLGNNQMIETPRSGVRICTVEDFAEGDIFLIVRPTNLSQSQKQKIRTSLLSQLGKKYDFIFDSQSPDRIVCSDLVCIAYDFIDWQTRRIAGHYISAPDDLVRSLLNKPGFEFELFLNKGKFVHKPEQSFIEKLLDN
jgi:hypothetical protein